MSVVVPNRSAQDVKQKCVVVVTVSSNLTAQPVEV